MQKGILDWVKYKKKTGINSGMRDVADFGYPA
jgi:hypothetical protein